MEEPKKWRYWWSGIHNLYESPKVLPVHSTKINTIPAHNFVMIGGDFNDQLRSLDALFTTTKATNRNSNLMKDFMERHNTRFQNRINRLWTDRRPGGQPAQLDFILVGKKWINAIKNFRAYSSFEGINSHRRIASVKCDPIWEKQA